MNIKYGITREQVKLILGNRKMEELFLWEMRIEWEIPLRINRNKIEVIDLGVIGDVTDYIVKNWNYESCLYTLRNMFVLTKKYKRGSIAKVLFKKFKELYNENNYDFPFTVNNFDNHLNDKVVYPVIDDITLLEELLTIFFGDIRKLTFLKIFNTLRNDYLEYLIFNSCSDVIPTFSHKNGVDFFINGVGFDQKVSRSVTKQFKKHYGVNWRNIAIENPYEVCRYLMMYGDESRFSNVPRLFIVDIDGDYELDGIEKIVRDINFDTPHVVDYVYNHKSTGDKEYSCPVLCLLLRQP
jgi:hypothetical protein